MARVRDVVHPRIPRSMKVGNSGLDKNNFAARKLPQSQGVELSSGSADNESQLSISSHPIHRQCRADIIQGSSKLGLVSN